MTVPAWRRDTHENGNKEGYEDATTAAEKLLKHTMQKLNGKAGREYFSKSETFTKRVPLLKTARKIYRLCKKANLIYPTKVWHFKKRQKLVLKAILTADDMFTYLTLFNEEKHIPQIEFWTGLVVKVDKLLRSWIKSDERRKQALKEKKRALREERLKSAESLKSQP